MKLVIFGLTITSSWGNGHATLWRALCRSLIRRGHKVVFFERDVSYYAMHRDLETLQDGQLHLYSEWPNVADLAKRELSDADVGMVTSYCADGIAASILVLASGAQVRAFYDLDTPVTLDRLRLGERVPYLPPQGLGDFDLVLSYTGGQALEELRNYLHARNVLPLYGSVDPEIHHPVPPVETYRADFSYFGTYAADRQATLETLFIEPARRLREKRFLIGGAQYPPQFPWAGNIYFVRHIPPYDHSAFYCSSKLTLNVTRRAMAQMGYCPSGRLFEAAACGTPIVSDWWPGLDQFFQPAAEILVARTTKEAIDALQLSDQELASISRAARERVLSEHTADHRAIDLERALESVTNQASPKCCGERKEDEAVLEV
jgi:spore maturation protein CgeB